MRFFRSHRIARWIWLFMAVYMLNISVDTPDKDVAGYGEELIANDLESFLEIVLETGLGMEGAIGEHGEYEDKGVNFEKEVECATFGKVVEVPVPMNGLDEKTGTLYLLQALEWVYLDRSSPPPEMA